MERREHGRLPWDLSLAGLLVEPVEVTPNECLEEPLGGLGVRGGQLEGKLSVSLKVLFISTFALNSIGHTCSNVFPLA